MRACLSRENFEPMAEEDKADAQKSGEAGVNTGARKNIDAFNAVSTQADDMVKEFNVLMDDVSAKLNAIAKDLAELENKLSAPAWEGSAN